MTRYELPIGLYIEYGVGGKIYQKKKEKNEKREKKENETKEKF